VVKRLNTADFIERAKAIHGERYDYSEVDYANSSEKVAIHCPEHGRFWQLPGNHLAGKGCKPCADKIRGSKRKLKTADFIERARAIHGDRYDYSKVVYVASIKDVIIICPEHGEFKQRPANHNSGRGCLECGGKKPLTLDGFVERANKIHNGRYDYSRVAFQNVESKVEIICPDHGSFHQRLFSHLKGFGCDRCGQIETGKSLAHSLDRFLEDARRAHGDKYDYSQVEYVNALSKVTIVCPKHGAFRQIPANHIRDIGCPRCGDESTGEKRTKSIEEFLHDARAVHGDRYDYSKVEYKAGREKIQIICAEHGAFWQSPSNHTNHESGCPDCADSGFDPSEPGILYYVAVTTDDGDTRYKIGITNLTVKKRFPAADLARIRIVKTWRFAVGRVAEEREAEILYQYAGDRYYGPDILVGAGNTELFTHDVLGLDTRSDEYGEATVDEDAKLSSRQIQSDFDF